MDKSWIDLPRKTVEYLEGLDKFLDFAFDNGSVNDTIKCPCPSCRFNKWATRDVVCDHLICKPFLKNYKVWIWHRESYETITTRSIEAIDETMQDTNPTLDMINDFFGTIGDHAMEPTSSDGPSEPVDTMLSEEHREFDNLIRDSNEELYEGCEKFSKLSFLLRLYHIKCLCGVSDKAMTLILELLKEAFEYAKIPTSFYEAKKVIHKLGLNYTKIDVCRNNCMLYWGANESLEICKHCKKSRWKRKCKGKKKVPEKVLRYFPLKQRLQRLFMFSKTAKSMSHDCHILMQHLLPLAIRNILPDGVTSVLVEFCSFFNEICCKKLSVLDLDKLQHRIVLALCHLEILLPLSFFTVMVHLTCYLVEEVKLEGPVHYRWMYPIERELGHLKSLVRNRAQPEGSISEAYLAEETLNFYSLYEDIESRMNRGRRVDDCPNDNEISQLSSIYPQLGRPVGSSSSYTLSRVGKIQAHRYLLLNCLKVQPYVDEYKKFLKRNARSRRPSATEIEKLVTKDFANWFLNWVTNPDNTNLVPDEIKYLARSPMLIARRYTTYNINGFKFRTMGREEGLKTQNSGVFLTSSTSCVASSADTNMRQADLPYYGKLEDIIELNYYDFFKVTLFKYKWADTTRGKGFIKDVWQFNLVNFSECIHTGEGEKHDPFIEASQTQMVYYVDDKVNKGWSVAVHMKPRDLYDMGEVVEDIKCESEAYHEQDLSNFFSNEVETITLAREDVDNEFISRSHVDNQLQ